MSVGAIRRTTIHGMIQRQANFEPTNLNSMTKVKLLEFAKSIKLDLSSSLSKKKLVEAIDSSAEFKSYEKKRKWTL